MGQTHNEDKGNSWDLTFSTTHVPDVIGDLIFSNILGYKSSLTSICSISMCVSSCLCDCFRQIQLKPHHDSLEKKTFSTTNYTLENNDFLSLWIFTFLITLSEESKMYW